MTRTNRKASGSPKPSRGRPRDPELEGRIYDAVLVLYSEGGWSGLTFDAIARSSGVGKSSLYRRWDKREDLLRSALKARWLPVHSIDTGTIRQDLRDLAEMILNTQTGQFAYLRSWFTLDMQKFPELREIFVPYVEETVLQGRAIVRRAVVRGELPATLNPGLLMDLIVGAVNNHVVTTPAHLRKQMLREAPQFLDDLIDVVLRGVFAETPDRSEPGD